MLQGNYYSSNSTCDDPDPRVHPRITQIGSFDECQRAVSALTGTVLQNRDGAIPDGPGYNWPRAGRGIAGFNLLLVVPVSGVWMSPINPSIQNQYGRTLSASYLEARMPRGCYVRKASPNRNTNSDYLRAYWAGVGPDGEDSGSNNTGGCGSTIDVGGDRQPAVCVCKRVFDPPSAAPSGTPSPLPTTSVPTTPTPTGTYGASYGAGTVRLIGPSAAVGRLEVYRDGRWGSVCDRHRNVRTQMGSGGYSNSNYNCTNDDCFGPAEGSVFCRQLGWSEYVSGTLPPGALANTAVPEGNQMEDRPAWYATLLPTDCSGDESRWEECPVVKDYRRVDTRANCGMNGLQPVSIGDCEAAVTSTSIPSCRDEPGYYCNYRSGSCWLSTVAERCPALCGECTQPPTTAPSTSPPLNSSGPTAVTVVSSDQIAPGCTTHRVDGRDSVVWNENLNSTAQCGGPDGYDCLCFDPHLARHYDDSDGDGGVTLVLSPAGCDADDDVWLTCGGNHSNTMSPTLPGQTYPPSSTPSTAPPSAAPTQWAFAAATVRLVGGNVSRCLTDRISGTGSSAGGSTLWGRIGHAACGEVAGRLEVKINGTWGAVTSDFGNPQGTAFGDDEAQVFCRQLGWSEGVRRTGDGDPTRLGSSPTEFTGGTSSLPCAAHHLDRDSLCAPLLPPLVQDINCTVEATASNTDSDTLPPSPSRLDRWRQCVYTERSIGSFGDTGGAGVGYPHSCTPGCDEPGQQGVYLACGGTFSTGSPTVSTESPSSAPFSVPSSAPSSPPTTTIPSEQGGTFPPTVPPTTSDPTTSQLTTELTTSIPTGTDATSPPTPTPPPTTLAPTPAPTLTSNTVETTTAPVAPPTGCPSRGCLMPANTTWLNLRLLFPGNMTMLTSAGTTALLSHVTTVLEAPLLVRGITAASDLPGCGGLGSTAGSCAHWHSLPADAFSTTVVEASRTGEGCLRNCLPRFLVQIRFTPATELSTVEAVAALLADPGAVQMTLTDAEYGRGSDAGGGDTVLTSDSVRVQTCRASVATYTRIGSMVGCQTPYYEFTVPASTTAQSTITGVSLQPSSPPDTSTTSTTTTVVVLYFPGDLATTSAVDQATLIASINTQLSAAYGSASVSTTLSSGSIVSTSVVSSPTIAADVATLEVTALAITGTSVDAEGGTRSSDGDDDSDDASNGLWIGLGVVGFMCIVVVGVVVLKHRGGGDGGAGLGSVRTPTTPMYSNPTYVTQGGAEAEAKSGRLRSDSSC